MVSNGEKLVGYALDIGEQMLRAGGEVWRVEDTIGRILRTYGFMKVDVFTITTLIHVTAVDEDGSTYTQFRRVFRWKTDLARLERLNQFSRDITSRKPELEEFPEILKTIREKSHQPETRTKLFTSYAASILAAGGFTVFFGGGAADAVAAGILAVLITLMNRHVHSKSENQLLYYFFFAIITGLIGNLLVIAGTGAGLSMNLEMILIGCIMLSIPGVAITYAVRDMLLGEIITGLLRFIESVLIATSIAGGYIISSIIAGGMFA